MSSDLHGNVPDHCKVALLLIDVINDFEFPTGPELFRAAMRCSDDLTRLVTRARRAKVPVIYVNDNFQRWRSDLNAQVRHCLNDSVRGTPFVRKLQPQVEDYFVLKPKHSGFYASPLQLLLQNLGAKTLILAGISAENCVYFTASDAYLRDYGLLIASDCVASVSAATRDRALTQMQELLKARVVKSSSIQFARLQA